MSGGREGRSDLWGQRRGVLVQKGLEESDTAGVCSLSHPDPREPRQPELFEPLWALEPFREESRTPKSPTLRTWQVKGKTLRAE